MSAEAAPGPGSLDQLARVVGAYRWVEHRLFEVTGAWATDGGPPALAVHAAEVSLQHAWHAELWEDRLPVLAGRDPAELTVAPAPVVQAMDTLAAFSDPADRLAGLYRALLPRLLATYGAHAARAAEVSEGPVRRALTLVCRDETEQWLAGEALLETLLTAPGAVRRAAGAAEAVEASVAVQPGLWVAREP